MKTYLFIVITLFASHTALAQGMGEKGNDGKIVQCPGRPAEVLDYQRAWPEFGFTPMSSIPGANETEKARFLIQRLERLNPKRVEQYLQDLNSFYSNVRWIVSEDEMPIVTDTQEKSYCGGGKILQTIVQIDPQTSFQKRYIVHKPRYDLLNGDQKAILITHEIILKETKAQGYLDANHAVSLNVALMSQELETMTSAQYAAVINSAGLLYWAIRKHHAPSNGPWISLGLDYANLAQIRIELSSDFVKEGGFDFVVRIPVLSRELFILNAAGGFNLPLMGTFPNQCNLQTGALQTALSKSAHEGAKFFLTIQRNTISNCGITSVSDL